MGWFEKIKKKTEKEDGSCELKRGEIKTILIDNFTTEIPVFKFTTYKNGTYFFERIRKIIEYNLYETFHISFGLKDKSFACSVSSTLNPTYRFTGNYNSGILTKHVDLIVLKKKTGIIPVNEAYYFHNGRLDTTTKVVKDIVSDFKKHGLRFLDKRIEDLKSNEVFEHGLKFYENITIDRKELKEQIELELKQCDYITSRIEHDLYLDLKTKLLAIPNQEKELRQKIPGFAYALLEYYLENE
ncbi:hypothetical protein [Algoriphagus resistens]|uniref:hypothetical protein n=1 Tax=Algoriphagus resistens TaxID=1750590 RepID=UPI00071698A0|nr:hypothetical protein [Algoriphagus resistens]